MQVGSDYGIDWDGPASMTEDEAGITVDRIDCPLSSENLAVVEEHFTYSPLTDRHTELLETDDWCT